jgi:hypothetical protein
MYQLPKIYNQNSYPLRRGHNYRVTEIKATKNGYAIKKFSDFVSVQKIKVVYNENGFAKATVKVDTNYRSPYQYTLYFDKDGNEIKASDNSDATERKMWLELQN